MPNQFTNDAARRIVQAVRYIEQSPRNAVSRQAGPELFRGSRWAVTTSEIGARTGTSPNFTLGKGTALILRTSIDSSSVATTSTTEREATIYHGGEETIASGRLVQVKWIDNALCVDVDYCDAS